LNQTQNPCGGWSGGWGKKFLAKAFAGGCNLNCVGRSGIIFSRNQRKFPPRIAGKGALRRVGIERRDIVYLRENAFLKNVGTAALP
jgi:hypothetical protein